MSVSVCVCGYILGWRFLLTYFSWCSVFFLVKCKDRNWRCSLCVKGLFIVKKGKGQRWKWKPSDFLMEWVKRNHLWFLAQCSPWILSGGTASGATGDTLISALFTLLIYFHPHVVSFLRTPTIPIFTLLPHSMGPRVSLNNQFLPKS